MNFQERKARREIQSQEDVISAKLYNIIIGATLALGFIINVLVILLLLPSIADMTDTAYIVSISVFALSGIIIVYLTKNPVLGVFGYVLFSISVGIFWAFLVSCDIESVLLAVILTGIVTIAMSLLSVSWPTLFSSACFMIPVCLILVVITTVAAAIMGYNGDWFSWIFVTVFSLRIGRDFREAQQYPKTIDNAIDAALHLYLDIMILFSSIFKGTYKKNSGD